MIKPIGAMLLVKKIESGEKTTKAGIVLSSSFVDSGPRQGEVVDMGEGEANAVTYVLPGKHCTARIFQNDNYQGLNKNLTSSFHLPLFQIYFGSEKKNVQANDRIGSILIETNGETI